ncbi:MAG TPA: hemerythrin domain-containing protein [Azospirillaceae bacterium]|nr:hemerythrin domain-containing protein [Azospirillaceae bacterium]
MNIQQAMRVGPARVNELFAKLAETGDGAVKTRETLFADLKGELAQIAELEERHLLPLLARHKETKDLVQGARDGNKALAAQLKALEAAPKNDGAFLQGIAELRRGFQQHVRDGRSELLPAVQKVLSEDEAREAGEKMEAALQQAEQAKRDEADAARGAARAERERARQAEAVQTAATELQEETARTARDTSRKVVELASEGVRRGAETFQEGASRYMAGAQDAAGAIQTVTAFTTATGRAMAEVQAAWGDRVSKTLSEAAAASRRLVGCTDPAQIAQVQRDFLETTMRGWVDCNERVLQASRRAADELLPVLQNRSESGPKAAEQFRRRSS